MAGEPAQMVAAKALSNLTHDDGRSTHDPIHTPAFPTISFPTTAPLPSASSSPPLRGISTSLPQVAPSKKRPREPRSAAIVESSGARRTGESRQSSPDDGGAFIAARKNALSLNLRLQVALREELRAVDDMLAENRTVLGEAEKRLTVKRMVKIGTTTEKFVWTRAVEKFLAVGAHPGKLGLRREQEILLRTDPVSWLPEDRKALWDLVGKLYPKAVDPATAVAALPSIDWEAVAKAAQESLLGTHRRCRLRTAEECRLRWIHYEMVGASDEEEWTKEEDWAIIQEAESRGSREWVKIAEAVNAAFLEREGGAGHAKRRQGRGRTPVACLRRYQRTLNTTFINRYSWSEEEDRLLRLAVKRHGNKEWLRISRDVADRSPVQCYNRWVNARKASSYLNDGGSETNGSGVSGTVAGVNRLDGKDNDTFIAPTVTRRTGGWTVVEERRLCLAVRALTPLKRCGTKADAWYRSDTPADAANDAETSPDRDPQGQVEVSSALDEHQKAKAVREVDYFREIEWPEVAKLMCGTRSEHQCREKWFEALDPSINRLRKWEPEEDAQLLKSLEIRTRGKWRAVERDMADFARKHGIRRRTDQSCRRRFRHLQPDKYKEHVQWEKDRRDHEPRLNSTNSGYYGGRTQITFTDYLEDNMSEEEEEEEGASEGDVEDGDDGP